MKKYVYIAAGLFNVETNTVNAYLTKKLESSFSKSPLIHNGASVDAKCYLPQRDGFEVGKIAAFLHHAKKILPHGRLTASDVVMYVPYYLDLGYFMSEAVAVIANLDEPIDAGLVVEISYARLCNIPVIGIRTDLRTPLGETGDILSINPFVVEQCSCFIWSETPKGNYDELISETDKIIDEIEKQLRKWAANPEKENNMKESENPIFKHIVQGSDMLFSNLTGDIHSKENMTKIIKSFEENQDFLLAIAPETKKLGTPGE